MCTYVQCACTCTCICHRHGKSEATIHIEFRKDCYPATACVSTRTWWEVAEKTTKRRSHDVIPYTALLPNTVLYWRQNEAVPDLMKQTWQESFAETNCTKMNKCLKVQLWIQFTYFVHARNTSTSLVLRNRLPRTQSIFFPICWQVANKFNDFPPLITRKYPLSSLRGDPQMLKMSIPVAWIVDQ